MADEENIEIGILVDVSQVTAAADALQGLKDAGEQASLAVVTLTGSSETGAASLSGLSLQANSASETLAGSSTGNTSVGGADKVAQSLSKSASSALSAALKDVVIDGDSFSAAASALSTRLASSALSAVSSKIIDSLTSGLFSSVTGSSSGGGLLSFLGFANGGVMTAAGPAELRAYAGGGVADEPQLALFGEGASAEAFVPLPDGRSIPVTMRGGGNAVPPVTIQMSVAAQDAASFRRSEGQIGATVAAKLQRYLQRYG